MHLFKSGMKAILKIRSASRIADSGFEHREIVADRPAAIARHKPKDIRLLS
jgi:hypothetical protein